MSTQAAILYMMGFSMVIVSSYWGQKMDKNILLGSLSPKMRLVIHYGTTVTALFGFIYFIWSFFVFGWWGVLLFLGSVAFSILFFKISFRYHGYLPLVCSIYIILANTLCIFSLVSTS